MKMKKILCVLVLLALSITSFAQPHSGVSTYKKFRVDLGAGVNFFKDMPGFTALIEPKFSVSPTFSFGLRAEVILSAGSGMKDKPIYVTEAGTKKDAYLTGTNINFSINVMGTMDLYLFPRAFVRPYLGVGVGFCDSESASGASITYTKFDQSLSADIKTSTMTMSSGVMFLVSPRLGLDIWHFRLNMAYNIPIGGNKVYQGVAYKDLNGKEYKLDVLEFQDLNLDNLAFQLIFFFGGGRK